MMAGEVARALSPRPFAAVAPQLVANGYRPVPIKPERSARR